MRNTKNNKSDAPMKESRRSQVKKHPLKSSKRSARNIITGTLKEFYQMGGRDYEQYRLWLQTSSKFEEIPLSSATSIDSSKIKKEPSDVEYSVINELPTSTLSRDLQSPPAISKQVNGNSLSKSAKHLSVPKNSETSVPPNFIRSSWTPIAHERSNYGFCHSYDNNVTTAALPSSLSLNNWSVDDVGRFIDLFFKEKSIVQKFIEEKIDGRTLQLLTEDHLTRIFQMKLGPALYLLSLIANIQLANLSKQI